MKKTAFLLALATISFSVFSQTYYVSAEGNDSNNGLTELTAWETLNKVANTAQDGDTILFRRGDIFRGSIDFTQDTVEDLYISNYGNQADTLPIISGSVEITGWSLWQDGIYEATVTQDIKELFADNKYMTLARYPNSGWLTIDEVGSGFIINDQLADKQEDANDYWNGAKFRFRAWSWWFETRNINNYDAGGKIYTSVQEKTLNWKFYLDNKLEELDSIGEWFYDGSADKMYFKPPAGVDPNDMLIEGSLRNYGMQIHASVLDGIWIRHQVDFGLHIKNECRVLNCVFTGIGSDAGGTALKATWDVINARIMNNHFEDNLNNGISWNVSPGNGYSLIQDNTFINTGAFPAKGGQGSWHACGIIIMNGEDTHVQYNYINNCGYAGILLGHENNYAEYNIIKRAMSTLNDGGGIYTNCSRSTIRHNIILDTEGDLEGSGPWKNLGHGIWPEFLSNFRESVIENNIVAGSGGYGLFLPNNFECLIRNNIFYNNARGQIQLSGRNDNPTPQDHLIDSNIFFGAQPGQMAVVHDPNYDYGTLYANYICNPFDIKIVEGEGKRNPQAFARLLPYGDTAFRNDIYKIPEYRSWNHENNILQNPEFEEDSLPWIQHDISDDITILINDEAKLEGKSLSIAHNSGNAMIDYKHDIRFEQDQFYELTFDYYFEDYYQDNGANMNQTFQVWVYDNAAGESIALYPLNVNTKVRKAWFVFKANAATDRGDIWINVQASAANGFYIDNMKLSKVEAAARNYLDETKLIYNDTKQTASFSPAPGEWHNLDGITITGDITLEPFTGIVLVRGEAGEFPGTIPDFDEPLPDQITDNQHTRKNIDIYPNPNNGSFTISQLKHIGNIELFEVSGKKLMSISNKQGANEVRVSGIPQGIYIISCYDSHGRRVSRTCIVE